VKTFYYVGIILVVAIIAVNAYFYFNSSGQNVEIIFGPGNTIPSETTTTTETAGVKFIEKKCESSSDCSWQSTNCCPESAGAKWECINGKTFQPGCPKNILCPQYVSQKPTSLCTCEQGTCVEK